LRRRPRATIVGAIAAGGMIVLGMLLGAGKPAEFARFLILPVMALSIACAALISMLGRRRPLPAIVLTLLVLVTMRTPAYIRSLVTDARGENESRLVAARYLDDHMQPEDAVAVLQEPAPYAVPPLDFAHRRVLWLPPHRPENLNDARLPEWLVYTADDDRAYATAWWHGAYDLLIRFPPASTPLSPITWANKPVYIYRRARYM
jgi:hypothetical protein